jgi:hypothetical protein
MKLNKELTMNSTIKYLTIAAAAVSLLSIVTPAIAAEQNIRIKREASSSASPRIRVNLRAVVMQAKIETVSASSLTVSKEGKMYTVNITADSKIRRRFGGKSDLIEYAVGNMVNIWGTYTDATKTSINAKVIRNTSIQKRNGVFFGTVKRVGTGNFVFTSKNRGDQTVTISATSKLVNRKEIPITASDIKVGDKVRVRGLWDRSSNKITEVVHVKNFSLPAKSPKPSNAATSSAQEQ